MPDKTLSTKKRSPSRPAAAFANRRVAYYGGSFDPVHRGHLAIARKLIQLFHLDEFVFLPAFHAPHKIDRKPISAFHRYAMLSSATNNMRKVKVSTIELDLPEKSYTVETLGRLKVDLPDSDIFFVMGADSWQDMEIWREWEKVLLMTNHIVVTRPGFEMGFSHVTEEIRNRIVDMRKAFLGFKFKVPTDEDLRDSNSQLEISSDRIYITDAVSMEISSSAIRQNVRKNAAGWQKDVPREVAKYIEKYQIYK